MPVLTIGIVQDCFYLLNIFYSEKFSTWLWRLPFLVNENRNLSIGSATPSSPPKGGVFALILVWKRVWFSNWGSLGPGWRSGEKRQKAGSDRKTVGKRATTLYPPQTTSWLSSLASLFFFFFLPSPIIFHCPANAEPAPRLSSGNYRNVWIKYLLVQFERKKDKYSNSKWNLRSLFCWRSNLSNDDMIYWWPGQAENGSEKWHLLVWNVSARTWRWENR